MPSKITVTAKTGPAFQNTTLVLNDVTALNFDLVKRVVQVWQVPTQPNAGPYKEYDLVGVTTLTCSISGTNYTWAAS